MVTALGMHRPRRDGWPRRAFGPGWPSYGPQVLYVDPFNPFYTQAPAKTALTVQAAPTPAIGHPSFEIPKWVYVAGALLAAGVAYAVFKARK